MIRYSEKFRWAICESTGSNFLVVLLGRGGGGSGVTRGGGSNAREGLCTVSPFKVYYLSELEFLKSLWGLGTEEE